MHMSSAIDVCTDVRWLLGALVPCTQGFPETTKVCQKKPQTLASDRRWAVKGGKRAFTENALRLLQIIAPTSLLSSTGVVRPVYVGRLGASAQPIHRHALVFLSKTNREPARWVCAGSLRLYREPKGGSVRFSPNG